uniref:Fungal lipase-like domain-containing protein n=1 Tax=Panagrolaimus sp. JU765 TaxID=591449 RepID=A0AC34RQR6_9BILA
MVPRTAVLLLTIFGLALADYDESLARNKMLPMAAVLLLTIFGFSLATYDESLARNKMLPMAGAAYSDNPSACLANAFSNAQLKRQITLSCDIFKGDKCSGFTAVSQGDQAIIISFRGSQGFLQILSEGGESVFGKKVTSPIGGGVSEYFYNAFDQIWNAGMKNDFITLKNQYPGYKIWVTGHSLGGSMASICASLIVATNLAPASNVYLYTFGQPRTGDTDFASKHDALNLAATNRVTHSHDIVPHVPPENFEDYYHHKSELFYDNDMTIGRPYVDCESDESGKCSDGNLLDLSINDHLHYFDKDVSGYGEDGCIGNFAKYFNNISQEKALRIPHDKVESKPIH